MDLEQKSCFYCKKLLDEQELSLVCVLFKLLPSPKSEFNEVD